LLQLGVRLLPELIADSADRRAAQLSLAESMFDDDDLQDAQKVFANLIQGAKRTGDIACREELVGLFLTHQRANLREHKSVDGGGRLTYEPRRAGRTTRKTMRPAPNGPASFAWTNLSKSARTLQKVQMIAIEGILRYREYEKDVNGTFESRFMRTVQTSYYVG
jgi:hypothetical protein